MHTPESHYERKGHWQYPDRGRAELSAPHANGDHRDNVVEAEDGMFYSGDKAAAHVALTDMRDGDHG